MELSSKLQSIGVSHSVRLDLSRFLEPVSSESPAGESLRYEGTYDEIRAARTEDNPVLSRGVWLAPLRRASWTRVEALCVHALENRSKDLQIAVWLTEALLHLNGFAGLQDGLELQVALCTKFWDKIHPLPSDGDLEYRLAPFAWMGEKFPSKIKAIPLSDPKSSDLEPVCWSDWQVVCRGSERERADFHQGVSLTPLEFYAKIYPELEACVQSCDALELIVEKHCGQEAPRLSGISRVLTEIREFVEEILVQRGVSLAQPQPDQDVQKQFRQQPDLTAMNPVPIRSRAEAYNRLAEAADFLARTEPHSPAPYLIRRAIKWGGMQFADLLPELVRDGGEIQEICRLLQIAMD